MAETETGRFATTFEERTEQYLDRVDGTVTRLPMVLETYRTGRTSFHQDVDEVRGMESACDDLLAVLRRTIASSTPNFTGIYLQRGDVLELFVRIDEVVNRVETFLTELAAMCPALSDGAHDDLVRMADLTAQATSLLTTATTSLIETLCRTGTETAVTGLVDEVRTLESRCDTTRTKLLADAFAEREADDALLWRELAVTLDAAMDAVEDAADQLSYIEGVLLTTDDAEGLD